MNIDQIIGQICPLPPTSKLKFLDNIEVVRFPKRHLLLRADKVEKTIYFIKSGIVRAYAFQNNNEITFWFGKEGEVIVSMKSYVSDQLGYENIELLEDGEFYALKIEYMQKLFADDIHIANWGRKFAEQELIKTEERLISRQFRSALERYRALLQESPDLLQRVPLGHIASYLGITQVTLSRIRGEI